jgi:hypothetical protein
MARQKSTGSGKSSANKRRNIAVKLTDLELKQLRQMALDTDSSSVDIVTAAIREFLRKHFGSRK